VPCPTPTYPRVAYPTATDLPYTGLPCSSLPYTDLPCRSLPYADLPYTGLPCSSLPYTDLPCRSLPYADLPYTGLPYTDLPYSNLPYRNRLALIVVALPSTDLPCRSLPYTDLPCRSLPYADLPSSNRSTCPALAPPHPPRKDRPRPSPRHLPYKTSTARRWHECRQPHATAPPFLYARPASAGEDREI
jgi:hypothetical protein